MRSAAHTAAAEQLAREAWLGDAVLTLYARLKILREDGVLDGAKSVRMTSNQFLATIMEPTALEAEIGRCYLEHGLSAAFEWVGNRVIPAFQKQEENRVRKSGKNHKR